MSVPGNLYTPTIRKTRGGDYLIEQSLLFDGSTTYLNRTPGTAGNRKTWTYSVWFKHVVDGSTANLFFGGVDLSNCTRIQFQNTGSINLRHLDAGVVTYQVATNGLYRDPSAWYHLVVAVDTTQATAADRVKIYINGIEQSYATTDYPAQNFDVDINSTAIHYIGRTFSTQEWDGLMALPILVDGAALDPTSFGEEDDDGYWNPIEFTGTTTVDLVPGGEGTLIGNMTSGGGLAAAFDGTVNAAAASARVSGATGTVGKQWSSAKTITQYVVKSPSDDNFGGSSPITIKLQGSNDGSAWTDLHTDSGVVNTGTAKVQVVTSGITTSTAYTYHRIEISGGGAGTTNCAEVEFYEDVANSFGTNGFVLDFSDTSNFGDDTSGNGNDYTPNNFASTDQLSGTPTDSADDEIGNYCVWNPLFLDTTVSGTKSGSLSNGNLTFTGATSGYSYVIGTIGVTSGHWKMEFVLGDNDDRNIIGWTNNLNFDPSADDISVDGDNLFTSNVVGAEGVKINSTVIDTSATHANNGDTVGLSVDFDATTNNVKMYINNTEVASGDVDFSSYGSGPWYPATWDLSNGLSQVQTTNFGQSAFTTTNFPAAAKALATQNLPAATIPDGSAHFVTKLWVGNNTFDGTSIDTGMSSIGLGWVKNRTDAADSFLFDTIRGDGVVLSSSSTNAESTYGTSTNYVNEINGADGAGTVRFGASNNSNGSGDNIVGWFWKAGTTFNGTSNRSKAYVTNYNATSGFSIITYTGSSSSGYQTLNHKLGVAPKMVIIKNRGRAGTNWPVYHTSCDIAANKAVFLNTTAAQAVDSTLFNATFESTNIYVNSSNDTNLESDTYVAYCWAEVEGFSKFGSYTGNLSTDGPFVYTGFRPAFIMFKRTDTTGIWWMHDSKREPFNPNDSALQAENSNAETANNSTIEVDFLSNGFKLKSANNNHNANGGTYIFAAFAETPFQGDDGYTQARAR